MPRTAGLLTTGLWHSFSRELFQGMSAEARKRGVTLLAFLGNELGSGSLMTDSPELGNSLYRLIDQRRVDGLVVWTGALGNYVGQRELEEFVASLRVPLVTLGREVLAYPNIMQDEKERTRLVFDHLVEHGARRVLFVSGPAGHLGCDLRREGYLEGLERHGLTFDASLITPAPDGWKPINQQYLQYLDEALAPAPETAVEPRDWNKSHPEDRLFLSVLAERGLVPGRDFDAVLAATDLLAAIAIRQLNRSGWLVPSDVRVAGLDGDPMARDILPQALSTMPLNLPEQGAVALSALLRRLEGSDPGSPYLPPVPEWGTTCGCLPPPLSTPGLSAEAERRLTRIFQEPDAQNRFLLQWIRETRLRPPLPGADATSRMRFLWEQKQLLPETAREGELWVQQAMAEGRTHAAHLRERKMRTLFDIGQLLSSRFDRASMANALVTHLPRLGLGAFSLALFVDPARPLEGLQVLATSLPEDQPGQRLDASCLAPDAFFEAVRGGSVVVEALTFSGSLLGVLLLEHRPEFDLEFYQHVATQVSVALKGTLLKEEAAAHMETLTQAQENLREKEKLAVLGGLAAGVVHEVNTPLGAIVSINGQMEALTSTLLRRAVEAAPHLAASRTRVEGFLARLPDGWTEARPRSFKRELEHALTQSGVGAHEAFDQAAFLVEQGYDTLPPEWLELVSGPGGSERFRLIETLADIRRAASVNRQASAKMENYLRAIRSYIYRDRDRASASLVDLCLTLDTVLTLNASKLRGFRVERDYQAHPAVEGWSEALIQVWNNLVSNALFAMGDQGTLVVGVKEVEGKAVVTVADSGPGIPDEIQARIFEDFFTTKPIGIGTGLGLGIVRQVVHDHHGTIRFESRPGRTVFTVKLPLARPGPRPSSLP